MLLKKSLYFFNKLLSLAAYCHLKGNNIGSGPFYAFKFFDFISIERAFFFYLNKKQKLLKQKILGK